MKRFLPFFLSLLWMLSASSQELPDSAKLTAEMEDSISGMSITPVKKPKKLLKQVIKRVILDSERKRVNAKYKVEATFGVGSSTPFTASCILSAEAGLDLDLKSIKFEQFHYEGPFELSSRDTTSLKDCLFIYATLSLIQPNQFQFDVMGINSLSDKVEKMLETFERGDRLKITAYSIRDNVGRGAYRISFEPNNQSDYYYNSARKVGTAYFDAKTLHITQFKGKTTLFGERTSISYQIDYDDKVPVVKQIQATGTSGKSVIKATIQRIR